MKTSMMKFDPNKKGILLGICSKCKKAIRDADYDIGMFKSNTNKVIHVKCWLEEESEKMNFAKKR